MKNNFFFEEEEIELDDTDLFSNSKNLTKPPPIEITWHDIDLKIPVRHKYLPWKVVNEKHVLQHLSGYAKPGELLAILGSSGSGKTSLLNVLAGRTTAGSITGEVFINHEPVPPSKYATIMRNISGYVMQTDYLLPGLTVKEALMYPALFRLPSSMTTQEKMEIVEKVIEELRLQQCRDTKVGGEFVRGISGGERRRVSIAVQLLTNPGLLFLDEPTSGLDSTRSHNIMSTLKRLARRGDRTVVCSIHQPRSDIFELFDKILLLSAGQVAYFGTRDGIVPFFSQLGFDCPKYSNPADFAMDLITVDNKNEQTRDETKQRLAIFVKTHEDNMKQILHNPDNTISDFNSTASKPQKHKSKHKGSALKDLDVNRRTPSLLQSLPILIGREVNNLRRVPPNLSARIFNLMSMAFLIFIFVWRLDTEQTGVQNRIGIIYETLAGCAFVGFLNALALYTPSKNVYRAENVDGAYSTSAFLLAWTLTEIPFDFLASVLFSLLLYWGVGFQVDPAKYFMYLFEVFMMLFNGESIGCILLGLFEDSNIANTYGSMVLTVVLFLAGFFRSQKNFPKIWVILNYASLVRYGGEVISINEFGDLTFHCSDDERLPNGECPTSTGEQVLDYLDMQKDNLHLALGLSVLTTVVPRLLAYVALKLTKPKFQ
eukprot:CAMPEP_0168573442 /NCGR_PEP_ID=MMETSP0413-20121227/18538_1 /TAXON_ID=136452 /ORGANISM="Filamoeba nolandi, Strain NC-AS-23-1" /LENGTH=655 /DNA_ID=CAMNT_0008606695 /DNA_START=45 /DNA_END=2009 /DNA_ORIENTATION=-